MTTIYIWEGGGTQITDILWTFLLNASPNILRDKKPIPISYGCLMCFLYTCRDWSCLEESCYKIVSLPLSNSFTYILWIMSFISFAVIWKIESPNISNISLHTDTTGSGGLHINTSSIILSQCGDTCTTQPMWAYSHVYHTCGFVTLLVYVEESPYRRSVLFALSVAWR